MVCKCERLLNGHDKDCDYIKHKNTGIVSKEHRVVTGLGAPSPIKSVFVTTNIYPNTAYGNYSYATSPSVITSLAGRFQISTNQTTTNYIKYSFGIPIITTSI